MSILSRKSYGVNPVDISFIVLSTKYFPSLFWFSISNSFLALTLWPVITTLIKDPFDLWFWCLITLVERISKNWTYGVKFWENSSDFSCSTIFEFAGGLELNWVFHTHTLKDLALGWSKCLTLAWQIAISLINFPAIFDVKRVSY